MEIKTLITKIVKSNILNLLLLTLSLNLSGCMTSHSSKNLSSKIRKEIKDNYAISNGDIIAKFDLQRMSKEDKLFAPYYGKLINNGALTKKFLNDFHNSYRYKNFIQNTSYNKMGRLSDLLSSINKKHKFFSKKSSKEINKLASYFKKHNIPNKNYDFLRQFAKLHNSTKNIPLYVPIYRPTLTSLFGKRVNPYNNKKSVHHGIDLVGPINSDIYAAGDGLVEQVTTLNGYGNMIVIKHNDLVKTKYAHLANFKVKQGDKVILGQTIGSQGKTGSATGHHLHFEILVRNKPVNPMDFLEASL